jgi:hypothetical protein
MPFPQVSNDFDLKNYDLFTNGNVSINSDIGIGDIIGALAVGMTAYLTVVIPFLIGLFAMSKYYALQPGMNSDTSNSMNFFRLALKPLLWLVGGIIVYVSFVVLIEGWYGIDISSRLKFFLEARYDILVSNLKVTGTMLSLAKNLLFILDIVSTFVFWSISLLFIVLILVIVSYIFSILLENNERESTIFKRLFSAFITSVIATVLITIYSVNVSSVFFTNNATIDNIGNVTGVYDGHVKVIKYWVKLGLNSLGT